MIDLEHLISALEDLRADHGGEVQVRILAIDRTSKPIEAVSHYVYRDSDGNTPVVFLS